MFYLVRIFRTSSLGDSISRNPERTLWGGEERSQVIYKVCNKGQVVWTSKSWLIKENQIPKLTHWVLFYVWEDPRVWAHWNHSFDLHLSSLGPVSCVFTSWVSSGLTVGSGCSLVAPRWQVFFPSWVPSGLTCSPLVVASIADDCDILSISLFSVVTGAGAEGGWGRLCAAGVLCGLGYPGRVS